MHDLRAVLRQAQTDLLTARRRVERAVRTYDPLGDGRELAAAVDELRRAEQLVHVLTEGIEAEDHNRQERNP